MRKFLMSLAIATAVTLAVGTVAATFFATPSYSGRSPIGPLEPAACDSNGGVCHAQFSDVAGARAGDHDHGWQLGGHRLCDNELFGAEG